MFNSMKALILASVLSLAAASAALASDGPGSINDGNGRSGANAAPICDGTGRTQKTANDGRLSRDWCRVIATDGPGGPGDNNGRTAEGTHTYPVLAEDGPPGSPGDHNGRSAALVIDTHSMFAGGRGGISGEV